MDYNQEIIKIKLQESKAELDLKNIDYVPENVDAKINIQYSQQINEIFYKGEKIDTELVSIINQSYCTCEKEL